MLNISLLTGIVPNQLKIVKVIPIFKASGLKNYRTIMSVHPI